MLDNETNKLKIAALNNTKNICSIEEIKKTTFKWYYVENLYNKVRQLTEIM